LNAIYNDIATNIYQVSPSAALNTIKTKLFSLDVPDSWKDDYAKLVREYNQVYGRNVIPPEIKTKLTKHMQSNKQSRGLPTVSGMR
jgi:hypothetical protein